MSPQRPDREERLRRLLNSASYGGGDINDSSAPHILADAVSGGAKLNDTLRLGIVGVHGTNAVPQPSGGVLARDNSLGSLVDWSVAMQEDGEGSLTVSMMNEDDEMSWRQSNSGGGHGLFAQQAEPRLQAVAETATLAQACAGNLSKLDATCEADTIPCAEARPESTAGTGAAPHNAESGRRHVLSAVSPPSNPWVNGKEALTSAGPGNAKVGLGRPRSASSARANSGGGSRGSLQRRQRSKERTPPSVAESLPTASSSSSTPRNLSRDRLRGTTPWLPTGTSASATPLSSATFVPPPRPASASTISGTGPSAARPRRECTCRYCPSCRRKQESTNLREVIQESLRTHDVEETNRQSAVTHAPLDGQAATPMFNTLLGAGGLEEQQRLLAQFSQNRSSASGETARPPSTTARRSTGLSNRSNIGSTTRGASGTASGRPASATRTKPPSRPSSATRTCASQSAQPRVECPSSIARLRQHTACTRARLDGNIAQSARVACA